MNLLQTRVADFARAANVRHDSDSEDDHTRQSTGKTNVSISPQAHAGPSRATFATSAAGPSNYATAAAAATTAGYANGVGGGAFGYSGYGGAKDEDPMRLRGGATEVSLRRGL